MCLIVKKILKIFYFYPSLGYVGKNYRLALNHLGRNDEAKSKNFP